MPPRLHRPILQDSLWLCWLQKKGAFVFTIFWELVTDWPVESGWHSACSSPAEFWFAEHGDRPALHPDRCPQLHSSALANSVHYQPKLGVLIELRLRSRYLD